MKLEEAIEQAQAEANEAGVPLYIIKDQYSEHDDPYEYAFEGAIAVLYKDPEIIQVVRPEAG